MRKGRLRVDNRSDLGALYDDALRTAAAVHGPTVVVEGRAARVVTPEGWCDELLDLEPFQLAPFRKRGEVALDRVESFIAYVTSQVAGVTRVYARGEQFVAVLNDHDEQSPDWRDHRATYALRPTRSWQEWLRANGSWMMQTEFAEWLEDRIADIAEPDGATLMEIATTLRVRTAINFRSKVTLANGQVQMQYEEDIDGKAGPNGDIAIPERLNLVVVPYEGSASRPLEARFRWRVTNGKATFSYWLGDREREVRESVLYEAARKIEDDTGLVVLYGVPDA